ncbi:Imm59 family immunity protein [Listeria costaricensis]|uniref:Imm59 family immunity protein n=1 Tax=Listeria costaricensis TaxID=2026604 RepID=UPI000C06AA2A|nr:Imm59 family immunity protein [Listeria costaricensis]
MKRIDELQNIIYVEKLPVNVYNDHDLQPFEVVLQKEEERYQVFSTNERAGLQGIIVNFHSEEEAFEDMIMKARLMKKNYY